MNTLDDGLKKPSTVNVKFFTIFHLQIIVIRIIYKELFYY